MGKIKQNELDCHDTAPLSSILAELKSSLCRASVEPNID